MTAETILPVTTQSTDEKRGIALLKALGLDKVSPEQRELALAIADRYQLDPMLRHLVMIEGKPFITRDGLLWVAHRSHQLDGIEVSEPVKVDRYWRAVCTVWRKDMTHPITYRGRYPAGPKNDEEMAIKVAESMALRRAFNVAAPTVEERWASDDAEIPPPATERPSLADLARAKAEAVKAEPEATPDDAPTQPETAPAAEEGTFRESEPTEPEPAAPGPSDGRCGAVAAEGLMEGAVCTLPPHKTGPHKTETGSWPR